MNADELRAHSSKTFDDIKRGLQDGDIEGCRISAIVHCFQMLAEIAAQLDDLRSDLFVKNFEKSL
jgi:hypothetical protein